MAQSARRRHEKIALLMLLTAAVFLFPLGGANSLRADEHRIPILEYVHNVWQAAEGLPQNAVQAIAQTSDGYLWLATQEGLVRFDGVRLTVFDRKTTLEITNNDIRALCVTKDGSLWIGTFLGDLVRMKDGKFTSYSSKKELGGNGVSAIYEDDRQKLWVGTRGGGLFLFDNGLFTAFTTKAGLANDSVSSISGDRNGSLWIGTDGGLSRKRGDKFYGFASIAGLAGAKILSVHFDRDGILWIGTGAGGLFRFQNEQFTLFTQKNGLPNNSVSSIYQDRVGDVWIGTLGGLSRFQDGKFESYTEKNGLSDNSVAAIYEDPEGSLWVGTSNGGLNQFRKGRFTTHGTAEGLSNPVVWTVTEDHSGNIWAGTDGGGLNKFANGKFTAYTTRNGLSGNTIGALFVAKDGSLWISTDNGLDHIENGKITSFSAKDGLPARRESSGLAPDVLVKAITQDPDGTLWFGTDGGGLCRYKDGKFLTYTVDDGLPSNMILWVSRRRDGGIWIGTARGLSKFADGRFTNFSTKDGLASDTIMAMYEDPQDVLWIGTESGLSRMDNDKFTTYTARDGLFDDLAFQILEDDRENLWMSCNKGIFRVSKKELNAFAAGATRSITSVPYGVADGMKSRETDGGVQPAGWKSHDGKLWFPTIQGVVVIDANSMQMNTWIPPIHVEELIAGRTKVEGPQRVQLPAGSGNMEFRYTALSFLAPNKVEFKYKLDGFDKEWIDAGTRRIAYYTNIPPGDYHFTVIASNDDGVWNNTGTTVSIHLAPHYYEAGWFYALCALAFIAGCAGLYHARMKGLKTREKQLVLRVNERTAELQQEIAERERIDMALGRAEEKYRNIFERAIVGIFQSTPDGRYLSANPALAQVYGFDSAEELMTTHQDLAQQAYVDPGRREEFREILESQGMIEGFEFEARRKDGGSIWLSENASVVRDPDGNILYYVGTTENITQRKRAQAELECEIVERKAAELAAQAANRAKSAFLANMSHEIRTPMNGIMGMTELVLDSEITAEQRENLNTVKMSADSLLVVINDILDFSKIEAGKLELENFAFDLRECMAETLRTLSLRAHEKGLELLCSIDPAVPDAVIGDPGRLRQLVLNLAGNAVKFTERGEVLVRVQVETQTETDLWLHFTVSDTGVGIPAGKNQEIFGAFAQADDSITRRFGGTGLGLAISSRLAEMMDGRIWVESEPGIGSVFHFTAHLRVQTEFTPKPVPIDLQDLRDMPVLIVDDNATNRRLLVEILSKWGMRPTAVDGGLSALLALNEKESPSKAFRLILLDAQMPDMDGFTLAGLVKQNERLAGITIMMLTSVGFLGDAARCRELGITAYLTKPIRQPELLEAIRIILGQSTPTQKPASLLTRHTLHEGRAHLKILLAEDNPVNQLLAVRLLEKRGHTVTVANNGSEAVNQLSRGEFDIVLMDIQMPVMDGFEATAAIRSREKITGNHLPIIAMTAHALSDDEERCLAAGMDAYISKPVNSKELFEVVERLARTGTIAITEPLKN